MQLLGMGQDRPLLNQLLFLALDESGGSDLPSLMLKQVETLSLLPLPRHQGVQFNTKGLLPAVKSAAGRHVTGQPGIGVEQKALAMRLGQGGPRVLQPWRCPARGGGPRTPGTPAAGPSTPPAASRRRASSSSRSKAAST